MASYSRQMRRAMARGKKPEQITIKVKPHGGHPMSYERRDDTKEGFRGHSPYDIFNTSITGRGGRKA